MPRERKYAPPGPTNAGGYQGAGNPGGGGTLPTPLLTPGAPYGENTALERSMAQVPVGGGPPAPGAPAVATGNTAGAGAPDLAAMLAAATAASPPPPGGLLRPTERPLEALTQGLSTGDGAGPEALGQQANPVVDTLNRVAELTGDPRLAAIAQRARALAGR